MRNPLQIFTLFAAFTLLSCTYQTNNLNNLIQSPVQDNKILLEIVSDTKASNSENGFLYFRLYSDGIIEFDDFSNSEIISIPDRKRAKIDYQEVEEFRVLVQSSEFKNLKNEYKKITQHCDYGYDPVFRSGEKFIKVVWCSDAEFDKDFPQPLASLMRKARYVTAEFRSR